MKQPTPPTIKFQETPFEDTGNHTISIPDYQNYSKQNGLLKTMPQLQQFISSTTRQQPRKLLFLQSPKMEVKSQRSNSLQSNNNNHNNNYTQDITSEIRNRTPLVSNRSSQQQQQQQQQQFRSSSLTNLSPFANTTIVFKRIPPNSTGLIPVTWNSCYCPRIRTRQTSQPIKESFKEKESRNYYDKGFYQYLNKFSGEQSPKLMESNSLYTRVMNQKSQKSQRGFQVPKKISSTQKTFEESKFLQTSPRTINELSTCLHIDERSQTKPKTALPNKIISNILQDSQDILQNPKLVEQIIKLKKQQNLTKYDVINFVKNNEKVKYIYNDYHTIGSRGGYSRGALGSFYTR